MEKHPIAAFHPAPNLLTHEMGELIRLNCVHASKLWNSRLFGVFSSQIARADGRPSGSPENISPHFSENVARDPTAFVEVADEES